MRRRTLLKASLQVGIGTLLMPRAVLAAYPEKAFLAKEVAETLQQTVGSADIGDSDRIEILTPDIARDARLVPVRIETTLDDVESITLIVVANEMPLTAHYRLYQAQSFVTTRVRVEKAGEVLAVVKAAGALHAARRQLRVSGMECRA